MTTAAQHADVLSTGGNVANILGLLVSIAGFAWTLIGVYRSKNAADRARESAENARHDIFRASAMIDLAAAMSVLQEVKRLHRQQDWTALLDRYSALRATLITIRASRQDLKESHAIVIQGAIAQLRTIEDKVERAVATGQTLNPAKLNIVVSNELDRLSEVLGSMRIADNG